MIKKIFFQLIFFNFFFLKEVFAAESGGMPQLNPEFWVSQIFWLTLTFGILYIVLSKFILPEISANLELRKSQIQENIEAADKQRQDSESKIKEFEKIILKSKSEAKNIFKETREKTLKDINSKKETLEKQINEEIKKAEKEMYDVNLATAVIDKYSEAENNILFIRSDDSIVFNDTIMTTKSLGEKLKQLKDKDIIIAADKFVSTAKLNKILIELNKNKISNVTLLTNEK